MKTSSLRSTLDTLAIVLVLLAGVPSSLAQINFPSGRIAYSADGNQHDEDDWAATAVSLFMLNISGMQSRLVHYDYNCHLGNNNSSWENQMITSAIGGAQRFGLNQAVFFNDQNASQLNAAIANFAAQGNASSASDRLYFICAGPMEVPWRCINAVDPAKRQYITAISHSTWNNNHNDTAQMTHTWSDIQSSGVQTIKISDQNKDPGFNMPYSAWNWLNTSGDPDLVWLRGRIDSTGKPKADCSDSGMMWYLLTGQGDENGTPAKVQALWEQGLTSFSVNAGPDQNVNVPPSTNINVVLNGSVTAPGGVTYTTLWTKVSGPGNVSFANATNVSTTATLDQGGSYVLQLQAGGSTNYATDTIALTTTFGGLVAHYEFEGNVLDTSGNNNHGTAGGSPTFGSGIIGSQALSLDGVEDYVSVPKSVSTDLSIAAWVKTSQPNLGGAQWYGGYGLVDGEVGGVKADFGTSITAGKFSFGVGGADTTLQSPTAVNDGEWHQVTATRVSSTGLMKIYVDGVEAGSTTGPTGARTEPQPNGLVIGNLQTLLTNRFLAGMVDDVRLYDYPLSLAEIEALVDLGPDTKAPEVVIADPADGAYISETEAIPVSGLITDNREFAFCEFYIDGASADSGTNATFAFVAPAQSVGVHTLSVVGEDAVGNRGTNSITVNIYAGPVDTTLPTVNITSPTNGQSSDYASPLPVSVTASDNIAVSDVFLLVNGGAWDARSIAPYDFVVTDLAPGVHELVARATDVNGNQAFATNEITVVIPPDSTPPVVTITEPTDGSSVFEGQSVNVSATITDNLEVVSGSFYADGALLLTQTEPPYSALVSGLSVGAHTLAVVGEDIAGNKATNSVGINVITLPPPAGPQVIFADTFDGSPQTGTAAPLNYMNTGIDVPSEGTLVPSIANNTAIPGALGVSVIYTGGLTENSDFDGSFSFTKTGGLAYNFGSSLLGQRWALTVTARQTGTTAVDKFYLGVSDSPSCLTESDYDIGIQLGYGVSTNAGQGLKVLANGSSKVNFPDATTALSGGILRTYVLTVDETGATPNYTLTMDGVTVLTAATPFVPFSTTNRYVVFDIFDRNPVGGGVNVGQIDEVRLEIVAPPFLAIEPAGSSVVLNWAPDNWVLEEAGDLASGEWFEVSGATPPYLVDATEPEHYFRTRPPVTVEPPPAGDPLVLWATTNFPNINAGQVNAYKDSARNALAINTAQLPPADLGRFAAAEVTFAGAAGDYHLTLTSLTERDGECTFRVLINGVLAGQYTNPRIYPSTSEYNEYSVTFSNITVAAGATVRVEFNSDSNELVPESGGFAYARGRWRKLVLTPNVTAPSGVWVETGGVVVMECERTSSSLGNWGFSTTITPGWTGDGHLQFNGNSPSGGNANSPLTYQFKILQSGTYRLYLRARKNLEGAASDLCNDCYFRMAGNYTAGGTTPLNLLQNNTKFFGGNAGGWAWAQKLDDANSVKWDALYNFTAGEIYTLTMSGRSQRFNVDRIVLRLNGTPDATWQNASESPRAP